MKLMSYQHAGRETWGVVVGDGVADLAARTGHATLADFIASPDFTRRDALVAGLKADAALADVKFLPVIPRPEKIVCAVRNYMDHHQEVLAAGMQRELSEQPPIFLRVWRSQTPHNGPIVRPHVSESLDWEGELAVIIGEGGRDIAEADAWKHVAGYSCYNDASIREWQFHAKQIASGKNFESTGGFGPWMVTADEIEPGRELKLEVRLNGETVQSSHTGHMIFSIPKLINYASTIFTLTPGDVIATGTPAGVGWSKKPPRFMKPGDQVEVEIEAVGLLRNTVVAQD
ncbi:fumarylacetoacetate hydrolase family protein [Variovorax arabinosiphilus]|jgi:2-keto-4-pentenoate hydratase/2-oxohepta-3-ene-1,7-dioic acid hydratase in catechol pathway|uniref:fumarylacetoacetate hydrolase family protein n=1 Tax=Variovorax arabinosiphilus TaxID=3053498 RepID=UPI0025765638|nr:MULTISPECIES: fumarylacetoacetate hydrolase family protein [unclassified Variovorax]MDM0118724.1 fumarylacetoacetate hydrolase family protein [Variovorax sp. J2L1-78]MDM0129149.1 fumarylacetoacetate hydrolase family protein [Variovorax sp. J2L1-63]MDM0233064.1 fumarylacetoacetate hydrolase family protein [Variovorax sp. J2R1-6]